MPGNLQNTKFFLFVTPFWQGLSLPPPLYFCGVALALSPGRLNHITDPSAEQSSQSVSKSVSLGVEPNLGLLTREIFFFESHCPVIWGRPL
jgi:hypothetical protein